LACNVGVPWGNPAEPGIQLPSLTPPAAPILPTDTTFPGVTEFPDTNQFEWMLIARRFARPIFLLSPPDGSNRLFILEQRGGIYILDPETGERTLFMDLSDRVIKSGTEEGLLGMVFDPDYAENGYFYIHYTNLGGNTVVARYSVSPNPQVGDRDSEERFFTQEQPFVDHNGGMLAFGPDGMLYVSLGDGGSAGDRLDAAQSLETYLGKILRMNVADLENLAPADNPFVDSEHPLIYHYGLRNPWRFSFDAVTGDMYIGDVGQADFEEIDFVPAGSGGGVNFGWDLFEGYIPLKDMETAPTGLVDPIAAYGHDQGCAVTGGYVYRGAALPEWQGIYLYADFCTGNVWGLVRDEAGEWQNALLFETERNISSFGVDAEGELYLLDYEGAVFKLARR
jgi:glucose/arabinose dehydrogenase